MKKTFLFDLDDTLMWNMHDYSFPILDFVRLVIERLGPRAPDVPTIINLQAEIDSKKVKEWIPLGKGFSKERFPTSLAETYREISAPLGISDLKGEKLAYQIGTKAFSLERWEQQGLVADAKRVIDYLIGKGDELILVTKGDKEVQRMKISVNKLESMFDEIHIAPTKNKEVLEEIIGKRNKNKVWHVGNSIKSDILPAIESEIGAIYIPMETWKFEREHADLPKYNRLIKIDKISEVIDVYPRL
jgi:putative hydrolase of the HAD superfamily